MKLLITGASRGLGFHLASLAARAGHIVYAAVREAGALQGKLDDSVKERLHEIVLDVASESSIAEAKVRVREQTDKLDVIVNNAAILVGRDRSIEEVELDDVRQSFEVNTFGPMLVVKHFLPLLRRGENPAILNISSEAGSFSNAYNGDYPYAMSKAALNMFSQQLHNGLKKDGITAVAIHPGWMRTDMGGPKARLSPEEAAEGILKIAERKVAITGTYAFIDHEGNPMPI